MESVPASTWMAVVNETLMAGSSTIGNTGTGIMDRLNTLDTMSGRGNRSKNWACVGIGRLGDYFGAPVREHRDQ